MPRPGNKVHIVETFSLVGGRGNQDPDRRVDSFEFPLMLSCMPQRSFGFEQPKGPNLIRAQTVLDRLRQGIYLVATEQLRPTY